MSVAGWLRLLRRRARKGADKLDGGQQEFTFRAALSGLLIGCLLCFTNLYFGLQTGWISMMSLQSALIGFLLSKFFPTPISPQENVVLQTIAVATGTVRHIAIQSHACISGLTVSIHRADALGGWFRGHSACAWLA
ncbi:hypothetical protein AcW1_008606 [Taiwanofungus camphoratus]|nr:hypothetical protein AcW1_008606 [Antrodia cinnamomea]